MSKKDISTISGFVEDFVANHDIVIRGKEDTSYYHYNGVFWQRTTKIEVRRMVADYFYRCGGDEWTSKIDREVSCLLPVFCPTVDELVRSGDLKLTDNYICLQNGLYNVRKSKLLPHNKKVFCVYGIPFGLDRKAKCPNFKKFLREILNGDEELIRVVQEMFGYCLSMKTEAEKVLILQSDGSSGKSLLCKTLMTLVGESNFSSVSLKGLRYKFARVQIVDKPVNISTESDAPRGFDSSIIKAISSGDAVQMEEKCKPAFSCAPFAKLVFAMNELPASKDISFGLLRRLLIMPLENQYVDKPKFSYERQVNRFLIKKLRAEMSGILLFAIEGLERLVDNEFRFSESATANKALTEYRKDINSILCFVKECLRKSKDGSQRISSKELYLMFQVWSKVNGYNILPNMRAFLKDLRMELRREGFADVKGGNSNNTFFFKFMTRKDGSAICAQSW